MTLVSDLNCNATQTSLPNIASVYCPVVETGTVARKGRKGSACMPNHKERILQSVGDYPDISTRQMTLANRTSHNTACRVFKKTHCIISKLCRVFRALITHHVRTVSNGLLLKDPICFLSLYFLRTKQYLEYTK